MNLDAAPTDIFVHVIAVPAAAPWDQIHAARISAELGAPLPIGRSAQCLRRLGRWTPGRPGRFAIGYMRASEVAGGQIRTLVVEGQAVRFLFQDDKTLDARRRTRLVNAALLFVGLVSVVVVSSIWTQRRDQAVEAIAVRARQANLELRAQRLRAVQGRNLARMQSADLLGRTGSKVADDLAWLDATRDRRVTLTAVAWTDRVLEVSAMSATPPVAGAKRSATASGAGEAWWIDPPASRVSGAKPSVVSRAPLRRTAP